MVLSLESVEVWFWFPLPPCLPSGIKFSEQLTALSCEHSSCPSHVQGLEEPLEGSLKVRTLLPGAGQVRSAMWAWRGHFCGPSIGRGWPVLFEGHHVGWFQPCSFLGSWFLVLTRPILFFTFQYSKVGNVLLRFSFFLQQSAVFLYFPLSC